MRPIVEVVDRELVWVQPSGQAHEVRAGEEVVATLRFGRSTVADAEAAEQHWTFKQEGFWHTRVIIRAAGSDATAAEFRQTVMGSGGSLELSHGRKLLFRAPSFWRSEMVWQEGNSAPIVHIKTGWSLSRTWGHIRIEPAAVGFPDLALLVPLGMYLVVLHAQQASAGG